MIDDSDSTLSELIEGFVRDCYGSFCDGDDFTILKYRLKAWANRFVATGDPYETAAVIFENRANELIEKLNEEQRIRDEEYERQAKERRERIEKEGPPKAVYDEKSAMIPITADLLKSSSGTDFISEVVGRLVEERISTYNDSAVVQYRNGKMISCDPPDSALLRYFDN